ncbi:glycosyltransferase [Pollutimonas sp. M17]|uniref:glycosyltransferase n=1 Tax=Pollutimonas sp. M17 TaxID=2962065 RepID=UPI0021F4BC74|nr:glycosyltransferase [Pollutimonas sp. M17]UYO94034.1 glycosyltransferase [Pollutimonas sp. M17]
MKDLLTANGYVLDARTGVWARPGHVSIGYSDGDESENRLAEVIGQARDLSVLSPELRRQCTDWPSTYHLSAARANLLRPFQGELKGDILEIGSGCGAITRYLGECGATVLALEGSMRRAAMTRSRTRDLSQVTVLAESFDRFEPSQQFDVITLIGVLEYANLFTQASSPPLALLKRVRMLLKPDGLLLLAIENQMGLKYFAGAPEDHLGVAMYGIEGRYRSDQPQTFGRQALHGLIEAAGFSDTRFMAPLPDYKLPASIVTQAGLDDAEFDAGALAWQSVNADPQLPARMNFALELAWPEIFKNGLGLELANSFLIRAGGKPPEKCAARTLAYHYSTGRVPQYCKETLFVRAPDQGHVLLHYEPIRAPLKAGQTADTEPPIRYAHPSTAPYVRGHTLSWEFVQAITRDGWSIDDVARLVERHVQALRTVLADAAPSAEWNDPDTVLPGRAFDLVPQNIVIQADGTPAAIDEEWELDNGIPLGRLLFRSLLLMLASIRNLGAPAAPYPGSRKEFVQSVLERAGYPLTESDLSRFVKQEAQIQQHVTGLPIERFLDWHPDQPLAIRPASSAEQDGAAQDMAAHVGSLDASIAELTSSLEQARSESARLNLAVLDKETHIRNLEKSALDYQHALNERNIQNNMLAGELKALRASTSWKLTAPLRWPADQARRGIRLAGALAASARGAGGWYMAFHKARAIAHREGLRGMRYRLKRLTRRAVHSPLGDQPPANPNDYAEWLRRYGNIDDALRHDIRKRIKGMPRKPLISILMPVYDPPLDLLDQAIQSVRTQLYQEWELCMADDASKDDSVRQLLARHAREDARIKVAYRKQNGHISKASNSALSLATGEFVALLDNDDLLSEHALFHVAQAILDNPAAGLIYSDEDKIDIAGNRTAPYFKPDWNPDLFLSHNMINHLGCYRTGLVKELQGFRPGYEGSQDYDLALRCIETLADYQIVHIPRVLYHWRAVPGSTALSGQAKNYALQAGKRAIDDHFRRCAIDAQAELLDMGMYRVRYALPQPLPLVSLIIPTRNGLELIRQCIDSITERTRYGNYEILVVDNDSDDPATLDYFAALREDPRIRVLRDERPFNFSALNNSAARQAQGDYLCLMNNDIEIISPDWLEEMISLAGQPGVGAVGAQLWYPDDTAQHSGIIIGLGGVAGHSHKHLPRNHPGYFGRARLIQTLSAVTAACLLIRKSIYQEVGGLDDANLPIAFNDVDFCLRVAKAGYRNVWTPYAEMYHHESASRGYEDTPQKQARFTKEVDYMKQRWGESLLGDPAYNPNLTICSEDFSLAWPPRVWE